MKFFEELVIPKALCVPEGDETLFWYVIHLIENTDREEECLLLCSVFTAAGIPFTHAIYYLHLDIHCSLISAPDYAPEIPDLLAVAHQIHIFLLLIRL